jgi:hypothetical protein
MEDKQSKAVTDHRKIRQWVESRNGQPAQVKGTHQQGEIGMLRIDFPDGQDENLEPITWDEFFDKFEEENLAFLFEDKTAAGETSYFNKLINR